MNYRYEDGSVIFTDDLAKMYFGLDNFGPEWAIEQGAKEIKAKSMIEREKLEKCGCF